MAESYRDYPEEVWAAIRRTVKEAQKSGDEVCAAFDADGTLWDTDLGENFFKYQIREKLFSCPYSDPWRHYRDWKEGGDPRPAYLWLAQVNAGAKLDQVRNWAEAAVQDLGTLPIFPAQKKLIEYLKSEGVRIAIVTASVKWAVEPGALRLGLTPEDVLGVETAVEKGVVTDRAAGFMTYREGKVQAFLAKTQGRRPFLASGNTKGDLALLQAATHIQLAVTATHPGDELYPAESELQKAAAESGWTQHRFK